MNFTINSRKLNKCVTFSRPGNEYIFIDINGNSGNLGVQLFKTGGTALTYLGDDQEVFNSICKRWWKNYIKNTQSL